MKVDNLTLPASRCRRTSVDNEATRLNAAATSIPYVRIGVLALVFWISSMTCMRAAAPPSVKLQKYATLPLSFERQSPSEFVARGQDYVIDLRGVQATIMLHSSSAIGLEFVHGCQASGTPGKELPGKVNYIRGSDPRLWRLGLSTYESVTYHNLYPGIDIVYYGNQKQLEFDLVLKPGADIRSIRMRFSGQSKLETDSSGSLMLGDLRLLVPAVIQGQRAIPARYRVIGNGIVVLEVGAYDRRQPLIIDPTLVYSTRLGGGNGGNQGNAITVDASGNAYVTGYTYASDFPLVNAALAGFEGNPDSFISKINPTGTALAYTTYIGGSNINYLRGIAVDSTGAAWAVGNTKSSDFPIMNPYQGNLGGVGDAVVVKLGPTGALAFSTYLGGPGDDSANAVAVDASGNAYVTGLASTGFPSTGGAFQQFNQGSTDAFITKFTSNGSLVYSTLAGGTNYDLANGIAVDSAGNAYITGVTYSTSFPGAPTGGAQAANAGSGDAFVAKLNAVGSGLLYFTFLGGSGTDTAQAIA